MTKIELVKMVAKKTGIDQPTAMAAVEGVIDSLKESGFGSFIVKKRAQKTARNISKNTTMIIPAHDIPYFKPCKDFMEAVAKA